ncbi:hypothetical protein [Streptomyces sp. NPDC057686]|uniref:hypothetical protein n=1 Tax=Streptomyces sp. NPDC057686 TaxID=3346212 RepID=UPI0036BF6529
MTGTQLQRRTVILGDSRTADELAEHMHMKGARYVLLDTDGRDSRLAWAVLGNPGRFRLLNLPANRIYGADLFEVGNFPTACRKSGSSLPSKASRLPDGKVQVTGKLMDGCGKPVPGQEVNVFATNPKGNPGNGTGIARTTTDKSGRYLALVQLPTDGTRHTYSRTTGQGPLLPPAASSLLIPTTITQG